MKDLKTLIEEKCDISIAKLSKELGISLPIMYSIANGTYKHKPYKRTVKKICAYFGENYKEYL